MRYHVARAGLELEEERLARLVAKSRDGDERAWGELWLALMPLLDQIAGRWRVTGRLASRPDERSNVVVRVMGELREDGFRRLAELGEHLEHGDGRYRRWLARIAMNSAVSYAREHAEYLGPVEGGGSRWAELVPLDDALEDERADPLREIDARRILAGAHEELDPAQLDALCRWLRRDELDEIAGALELDGSEAATRLVRSALKRLRSRYAPRGAEARAILAAAGIEAAAPRAPARTSLKAWLGTLSGTVLLAAKAGPLDNASRRKCYRWEYTLDGGATFLPMPSTAIAKTSIADLTPRATVGFRVCVGARRERPGAWSEVVSVVVG